MICQREGVNPKNGSQLMNRPHFPERCMKSKKIVPGRRPKFVCRSAAVYNVNMEKFSSKTFRFIDIELLSLYNQYILLQLLKIRVFCKCCKIGTKPCKITS